MRRRARSSTPPGPPRFYAPVDTRKTWKIYRGITHDGRVGYIGQTERLCEARWREHMKRQWWADRIAWWEPDPRKFYSETAVKKAEREAIRKERPLFNDQHNRANPHRVRPPYRPAGARRRPRPAASAGVPRPTSPGRGWATWIFAWLVCTVFGAIAVHRGAHLSEDIGVGLAAGASSGLLLLLRSRRRY